jgi:glycosyltransferase involved in cell wall biosynthesis
MKIVLIGPVYPYRGGIAHYTAQLTKAMLAAGHDVRVISFKRQYPGWLYPGQSDRDPSQEPLKVPAEYLLDPLYPWTWFRTVAAIRRDAPDLVLFQWWTTFWAFAFRYIGRALKTRKIRAGYLIHNVIPHEARPWDRFLAKMALQQADAFLVQSTGQRDVLKQLIPAANPDLIELPVYDMFAAQKLDQLTARRNLKLPEQMPVVLFFGIVRPYKGLSQLFEAMGQLNTAGFQAGLYVAGEFWEDEQKYRQQIDRLHLTEQVWIDNRYIPNEELPIIFSAANVFAAPYTDATQSAAVKMALGFGLPIVVTPVVVNESMQPWINRRVFVCSADNPATIAEGIKQALSNVPAENPWEHSTASWTAVIAKLEKIVGE